jgi:hypothetical protein
MSRWQREYARRDVWTVYTFVVSNLVPLVQACTARLPCGILECGDYGP